MSAFSYHMRVIEAVNRANVVGEPLDVATVAQAIAGECALPGAVREIAAELKGEAERRGVAIKDEAGLSLAA